MSSQSVSSPVSDRVDALRAHIRELAENRPGIYRMLGPGGEILYIGKSIRIRTRLLSHLRAPRGEKAAKVIAQTHRIEWDYRPNEFAALLHEFRQIRHLRPLYNVEHKRDRRYSFIKLTNDAAPKLLIVGRVTSDGALYYGPFRGRRKLTTAIRELSDLLELRDCASRTPIRYADQGDLFGFRTDPLCIRAELRRCLAPCAARCTLAEYKAQVELARRFLDGDADQPLSILTERMQRAADRLDFEYAGVLRDRAHRLEAIRDELRTLRDTISHGAYLYPMAGHGGEDRVYLIYSGTILEEFPAPGDERGWTRLHQKALGYIDLEGPERMQIQPDDVPEILLVARWFRLHPEEREHLIPVDRSTIRDEIT